MASLNKSVAIFMPINYMGVVLNQMYSAWLNIQRFVMNIVIKQ